MSETLSVTDPNGFLTRLFDAAIEAADPARTIAKNLPQPPKGRTLVVGAGKGAAQMALALEEAWEAAGHGGLNGLVVTRYGYGAETRSIEIVEASHPVPDKAGEAAADRMLRLVSELGPDDLAIVLVAGGGSALLPAPPEGISLDDEIALNEALLASGAPISAMNTIRKHVSRIKGGRLAVVAAPAKVHALIVSDIPGDHLAYVASGPTVPDAATPEDAVSLIDHYSIELPKSVMAHLRSGNAAAPLPDDPVFQSVENVLIASAGVSLDVAAERARQAGIMPVILSDAIEGEAREIAKVHAAMALETSRRNRPFKKPVVLLSGGEATVTIRNKSGKGGPSTEFALSMAIELNGSSNIFGLCADTDGIDGSGDNAGAFFDGATISEMVVSGIDAKTCLRENESYRAFQAIDKLFQPGPTGTNVNDFRAVLITD